MGQFFLSYARADQAFALRLATDLRSAGCPVWVDQFDILPSQLWDRTVEAAVRDCIGLILILSPRSVASENVLDEVSVALDSGKRIIPVLFEKCALPLRLARVQFIDATSDYGAALERCKAAVLGMPSRSAATPPSPEPLPEPSMAEPGPDWHPEVIERAERNLAPRSRRSLSRRQQDRQPRRANSTRNLLRQSRMRPSGNDFSSAPDRSS